MEHGILNLFVYSAGSLASAKIKCQLCYNPEQSKVYKFVAHTACVSRVDRTARQKLELRIFLLISWVSAVDVIQL